MKKHLSLIVVLMLLLVSCKKKQDDKEAFSNALINNLWQLDQFYMEDIKQNIDSCKADDTWQFLTNNTLIWRENSLKCPTNKDSIKAWEYRLEEKFLTIIEGVDSITYSIKSLNNTRMELSVDWPYSYTYIFLAL